MLSSLAANMALAEAQMNLLFVVDWSKKQFSALINLVLIRGGNL